MPRLKIFIKVFRTVLRQQAHSHASSLHAMKQTPLVLEDEKPEVRIIIIESYRNSISYNVI